MDYMHVYVSNRNVQIVSLLLVCPFRCKYKESKFKFCTCEYRMLVTIIQNLKNDVDFGMAEILLHVKIWKTVAAILHLSEW